MDPAAARTRVGVAAAFAAQGFGFAVLLTHLPDFKTRWDIDDLGVTVLLLCVALLAGAGSAAAAGVAARRGAATALRAALGTAGAGLALVAVAPTAPVFYAGLTVYGLGLGGVDSASNMRAVALEGHYRRSILTSFHACWSAGGIAGALAVAGGARLDAPTAVTVLLAAAIHAMAVAGPVGGVGDDVPTAGDAQRTAVPWRPLALLGAALVLFYLADSAASTWSTVYLRDTLLAGPGVAPLAFGAYQATSLIARIAGDRLVRRAGSARVVRWAASVAVVGLAAVIAAPGPLLAIVGFAVLGAGVAVVAPLTFSAAGALASRTSGGDGELRRRTDAIVARLNLFNYVGFVLGGVLTGLVGGTSLRWGFAVPLLAVLAIVPLAPAFVGDRNRAARTGAGAAR